MYTFLLEEMKIVDLNEVDRDNYFFFVVFFLTS